MVKKVLIAEDQEMANISVRQTLAELNISQPEYVYYCDDALEEIKKALRHEQPYDLLITDLFFQPDHRLMQLSGGEALVEAVRSVQPGIKIIVISAEFRRSVVDQLVNKLQVDAFIPKSRTDAKDLKAAIAAIAQHKTYIPRAVADLLKTKFSHVFTNFEIAIIGQLAKGLRQKDIPGFLQRQGIQPSGLSSVEKCLAALREKLDFTNNEQLVLFCKEKGII